MILSLQKMGDAMRSTFDAGGGGEEREKRGSADSSSSSRAEKWCSSPTRRNWAKKKRRVEKQPLQVHAGTVSWQAVVSGSSHDAVWGHTHGDDGAALLQWLGALIRRLLGPLL